MRELSREHQERQRLRDKEYALADKQYLQRQIEANAKKLEELELLIVGFQVRLDVAEERIRAFGDSPQGDQLDCPGGGVPGVDPGVCL